MDTEKLPEVIDLFSGCGGLALGFQSVGFKVTHGIEIMPEAVETVSYNIHWRYGQESKHICGDITKIDPNIFIDAIGKNGCIVIGGPPCQAYSLVGRAKLKSLGKDRINTNDKRGYLYQDFLRFAFALNARAIVMENVPESVNYGGENIPQLVCEIMEKNGYIAYWTILNSADFGVPQIRERVIVIGIKDTEETDVCLPVPTHRNNEDKKTQNQLRFSSLLQYSNFRVPKEPDKNNPSWVTVGDALSDLPVLFPSKDCKYKLHKITAGLKYSSAPDCEFQRLMRNWYGKEMQTVTANCYRKTIRDYPIFEKMKQGDDYLAASKIADELFENACKVNGITEESDKEKYDLLKKSIVPPYSRTTFFSKWQKLSLDKPSHTLVAHLSVDTYSHIHPIEPRGISVREAARLQSFPDGFLFQCSMGNAYKQIGNAVPPLLAKGVALQLKKSFSNGEE